MRLTVLADSDDVNDTVARLQSANDNRVHLIAVLLALKEEGVMKIIDTYGFNVGEWVTFDVENISISMEAMPVGTEYYASQGLE